MLKSGSRESAAKCFDSARLYSEVEKDSPERSTVGSIQSSDSYFKVERNKQRTLRGVGGGTPRIIGWGCAAPFLKPLPHFMS